MQAIAAVGAYLWDVFWGWQTLALGLLGLNELSEWQFKQSWKWLHHHRRAVALALLFVAQGVAYYDLSQRRPATKPAPPVVAENPDHATLDERLRNAEAEKTKLQQRNTTLEIEAASNANRIRDLETKLSEASGRIREQANAATPAPELSVTRTTVSHNAETKATTLMVQLSNLGPVGTTMHISLALISPDKEIALRKPDSPMRLAPRTQVSLTHSDIFLNETLSLQVRLVASFDHSGRTLCYTYLGSFNKTSAQLNYISGDTKPC